MRQWIRLDAAVDQHPVLMDLGWPAVEYWRWILCRTKIVGRRGGWLSSAHITPRMYRRQTGCPDDVAHILEGLIDAGMLRVEGDETQVVKWADYQQDSTAAERMRRYRARDTTATDASYCNDRNDTAVTTTGQDRTGQYKTETETEREANRAQARVVRAGARTSSTSTTSTFDQWWESYPKKVGKKAAHKAWDRARDKPPIDELVAAVERQAASPQWQQGYVPNPATWLNEGRWDDEPQTGGRQMTRAEEQSQRNQQVLKEAWDELERDEQAADHRGDGTPGSGVPRAIHGVEGED